METALIKLGVAHTAIFIAGDKELRAIGIKQVDVACQGKSAEAAADLEIDVGGRIAAAPGTGRLLPAAAPRR